MFEKENHFGKEKGKDCCCIRRQVLYKAPDRHLRQLVHFEFLEGLFFELLRGCKIIRPLNV
jgi:hypothetical protein